MKISKFLHSCVLVEDSGQRILIDPGAFSFIENRIKPEDFKDITAVLFTHRHTDHFDKSALITIIQNNPNAKIVSNSDTLEEIKDFQNTVLLEDGEATIGNFSVKAFFAEHEDVGAPVPKNTALVINEMFLHPGDSLKPVILQHKTKVLAVPVQGPWLTRVMALNFVNGFKPQVVFPIHDVYVKEFFQQWDYGSWQDKMTEQGIEFKSLSEPGQSFEI